MNTFSSFYNATCERLERADWLLPTLARLLFAAVLLVYFLNSGMTKLGTGLAGIWTPSTGAYAQIFPRVFEAVGYDSDALSLYHQVVVVLGTWAEFVLPALIVLGFMTRIAALGMTGFIVVQSLTDVYGHHLSGEIGAWFDRFSDALIMDQRALWIFLLIVIIVKGAGPLSFDRAIKSTLQKT